LSPFFENPKCSMRCFSRQTLRAYYGMTSIIAIQFNDPRHHER
jgi:hypothetical protein